MTENCQAKKLVIRAIKLGLTLTQRHILTVDRRPDTTAIAVRQLLFSGLFVCLFFFLYFSTTTKLTYMKSMHLIAALLLFSHLKRREKITFIKSTEMITIKIYGHGRFERTATSKVKSGRGTLEGSSLV